MNAVLQRRLANQTTLYLVRFPEPGLISSNVAQRISYSSENIDLAEVKKGRVRACTRGGLRRLLTIAWAKLAVLSDA
jgi:hypothetical protein